jgi:hypothetical protein
MEFLRDRDVDFPPDATVHRETSWASLVMGVILLAPVGGVGYAVAGPYGPPTFWTGLGFFAWAAIMALPILLAFRTFRASLRPESWRFAWTRDRLFIRFRSFQNYNFDPDTPSVVVIAHGDVDAVRPFKRKLATHDDDGGWNGSVTTRALEIKLKKRVDTAPLRDALSEEAKRRSAKRSRFFHYPVTLEDGGVLRVEMRSPEKVLKQLPPHFAVTLGQDIPLTRFEDMTTAEKESHILDLILAGRKIDAIKAAREVYGYDLAEAKRMVDALAQS